MIVTNFRPKTSYLVVKKVSPNATAQTGFQVEENDDDFVIYAQVVTSSSSIYKPNDVVVFELVDSQSFRDGAEEYNFIHEDAILGTYTL